LQARALTRLIEQLGSNQFEERERATRQLMQLDTIPVELRAAGKSPDLEVRRRATRIIATIQKGRAGRALQEAANLAKEGRVDEVVERAVRWAEHDPLQDGPKALLGLMKRLVEAQKQRLARFNMSHTLEVSESLAKGWRPEPREEFFHEARGAPQPLLVTNKKRRGYFFLRGAGVTVQGAGSGFIASTGSVTLAGGDYRDFGIIISCGSVTIKDRISDSIISCDGDLQVQGSHLRRSLIIAQGNVTIRGVLITVRFSQEEPSSSTL
jgi:hypothetical protein